ncbi:hypothetical protein I5M32_00375 [Pedobacter sp. SD-b]|uniref:Lipocalin-like domain-containing protein n=1 Tax=Pedobacter segetis TaxID=2793069 RepID=A0ABS1BGN5_9SPHI|nr:hypothetical protein [Pedobacter segetis]MBK0381399.1 hypothetical protein [Pedobacter segetis]
MTFKNPIRFILMLFVYTLIGSCSFNQKPPSQGLKFLQGKWAEDSVENKNQLVTYQKHKFTFTCDSFYLTLHSYSSVNLQGGSCYDAKEWEEYAKGNYSISADTLKLNGNFVNQDFKYKAETSCYRTGKYIEDFIINDHQDSTLLLTSLLTGLRHQINLKERLVCKKGK